MIKKVLISIALIIICSFSVGYAQEKHISIDFEQKKILEEFKSNNPEKYTIIWNSSNNTPKFIGGKLSTEKILSHEDLINFLNERRKLFKLKNVSFKVVSEKIDYLNFNHYKLKIQYKGIELYGNELKIHINKDGYIYAINGKINDIHKEEINENMEISEDYAIKLAKKDCKINDEITTYSIKPTAKKFIFNENSKAYIGYLVELKFIKPYVANWKICVDAATGNIISKYNAVSKFNYPQESGPAVGLGKDVFGNKFMVNTYFEKDKDKEGGKYYLMDVTKPIKQCILTYDLNNKKYKDKPGKLVFSKNNKFTSLEYKTAVSAHVNVGKVIDFYLQRYNRKSFDDYGSAVISSVNCGKNYNNAYWNGEQLVFGNGDGKTYWKFPGTLDVVAHEFTHAVIDYTSELEYKFESGALNEAFCDIMACAIVNKENSWLLGEKCYYPLNENKAIRDLAHPEKSRQASDMSQYRYCSLDWDNGGVHYNAGIILKAAYNIGSKIGKLKMADIFYRANELYFHSNSDFDDARIDVEQATIDLYGMNSIEHEVVKNGFLEVGLH